VGPWTFLCTVVGIAILYHERNTVYVIVMSLYTRFINWKS
jgi:hypothetical protein